MLVVILVFMHSRKHKLPSEVIVWVTVWPPKTYSIPFKEMKPNEILGVGAPTKSYTSQEDVVELKQWRSLSIVPREVKRKGDFERQ